MNVGSYSTKFTPQLVDQWAHELGVTPQSKILIPTNTVADLDELKENLPEDEFEVIKKNMEGKYIEVDKPLSVGYMSLIELFWWSSLKQLNCWKGLKSRSAENNFQRLYTSLKMI